MKAKNTGAALSTRTASWQYDSADYAEGMDNNNHPSYKALSKYSGNQHGGDAQGNFGRGATKGNTGSTANAGPKKTPTAGVPALPKQGSVRDSINRGPQVRTPGGTRDFTPSKGQNYKGNADKINEGRGPTKGNSQ